MVKGWLNRLKEKIKRIEPVIEEVDQKPNFDITISREDNIYKMVISDYISATDYFERMATIDNYNLTSLIGNCILWNSSKQSISKGTIYVVSNNNKIYNILIDDAKIKIDERIKLEDITEERFIGFDTSSNSYHYSSLKHDKIGDTFYTRYYSNNRNYSLGKLDLSEEEAMNEMRCVINNLESIEGMDEIIDIESLKKHILGDISEKDPDAFQKKLFSPN